MPFKVIIVGAGIAGLVAAITLRRAGHQVRIFERSRFASEVGAALSITGNGQLVLDRLGVDQQKAKPCLLSTWQSNDGTTLQIVAKADISTHPIRAYHRVDLHAELRRLAVGDDPSLLVLGVKVVGVDAERGELELDNGSRYQADLIIGADGLHSVIRHALVKRDDLAVSEMNALRFLVPTERIKQVPALQEIYEDKKNTGAIYLDTVNAATNRHFVWYSCRGGDVQNIAAIHPKRPVDPDKTTAEEYRKILHDEFAVFDPTLKGLFNLGDDIKGWPLCWREPLAHWAQGRVVLIGDAAHPMLPFSGQGANMAIEDGAALGMCFETARDASEVSRRLQVFEKIRVNRAARIQIMSNTPATRETLVSARYRDWLDHADDHIPTSLPERVAHDQTYNVYKHAEQIILGFSLDLPR